MHECTVDSQFNEFDEMVAWGVGATFIACKEFSNQKFTQYVDSDEKKLGQVIDDTDIKVKNPIDFLSGFRKGLDRIIIFAPDFFSISELLDDYGLEYKIDYHYFMDFIDFHPVIEIMTDEIELSFLECFLNKGSVCVDVGANVGLYTCKLSQISSAGTTGQLGCRTSVHSFEPVPNNYKQLLKHVESLGLGNVTCYNFAVNDRDGEIMDIMLPYKDGFPLTGNCFLSSIPIDEKKQSEFDYLDSIKVETVALDSKLLGELDELDFMKIDVEGAEFQVLKGAVKLIEKFKPLILVELVYQKELSKKIIRFMRGLGYGFYWLQSSGKLRRIEGDMPLDHVKNYFFINLKKLTPEQEAMIDVL